MPYPLRHRTTRVYVKYAHISQQNHGKKSDKAEPSDFTNEKQDEALSDGLHGRRGNLRPWGSQLKLMRIDKTWWRFWLRPDVISTIAATVWKHGVEFPRYKRHLITLYSLLALYMQSRKFTETDACFLRCRALGLWAPGSKARVHWTPETSPDRRPKAPEAQSPKAQATPKKTSISCPDEPAQTCCKQRWTLSVINVRPNSADNACDGRRFRVTDYSELFVERRQF